MGWIKTRPAQKLLVRVKFTGNSYSYSTCVNVNGHDWNTCKLVFTGTCIRVPGLVLVSVWMHPYKVSDLSQLDVVRSSCKLFLRDVRVLPLCWCWLLEATAVP